MMMMAKHRIQSLSLATAVTRSFGTATALSGEHKMLYRRLSAVGANPNGSVKEVMEDWVREGRAVTEPKLVSIIRELRKFRNHKHALKVIDWMEKRGMDINVGIHAMRLDLISKFKGVYIAEKYFSKLPESSKNHLTYGALLNIYCHEKKANKALALYEKMKGLNLVTNTLATNNLMALYLKLGKHEKLQAQFQEMKSSNISPDGISYGIIISSYGAQNNIESIERVVDEMKHDGKVTLNWRLCCTIAGYYNSAGIFEKSEPLMKEAEKIMSPNDREAYIYLITLYAGAGNLSEVKRVWKLHKDSFGKLTNMSYFHMLHALRKLDDFDGLEECFEEWESVCVNYDVKLVNVVIDAFLRQGMVEKAKKLWEKAVSKGSRSDFRTLELFTDFYLEKRDIDSGLKFLESFTRIMNKEKWKRDKKEVKKLVKRLDGVSDVEGLEKFRGTLKSLIMPKFKVVYDDYGN